MSLLLLIIVFLFIGLLIAVMFFFLKKTVLKVNQQLKDYFVDKLQVYDDLINEKEKKLKGLNEELEIKSKDGEKQDIYLYDIKNIEYQDEDIFKKMKDVEKRFNVNNVDLLEEFITKKFTDNTVSYYNQLIEIKESFNHDMIYKILSESPSEQESIIRGLLKCESKILDDFKTKEKKFNTLKFISYFDKLIDEVDPYIYVYVGDSSENFDYVHPFIKTKIDENIYKGLFIVYRGILYDYSLK